MYIQDQVGITIKLLKTPTKFDATVSSPKANPVSGNSGSLAQEIMCGFRMLPTPVKSNSKTGQRSIEDCRIKRKVEHGFTIELHDLATIGLLPTPTKSSDPKGGCTRTDPERQNDTLAHAIHGIVGETGKTSQLNPLFVAEMMGFPVDWTVLPFQSGESSVSEPTETR